MTYAPTYTARAATAGELVKFRADGNASKLFAIFDVPVVVFVARINETFTTHDMVAALTFDTVSTGAYTACNFGMTVLISSAIPATPANTIGMTYVREAATSTVLYVGEGSEIAYADNLYITVLDEYGIWQCHIRAQEDGSAFIRYDVAYSDQHANFDPTPIVGTDRIARLPTGGTVTLTFTEGSYVIDGSAIASRVRVFPGASATTNLTSATSTATYNATGRYKYHYTVTAANGKVRDTWRDIYIYDDSSLITIDPRLDSFAQDWDTGGAEFSLTVLQDATTSQIRDRTKIILFEEAFYGDVAGSIGPLAGSENIVGVGWLDDESVTLDWMKGTISLTAKTAHYWLNKESAFVLGYKNVSGTAAKWTEITGLTPDLAAWDAFAWRTTVTNCVDIQFTADTRQAVELQAPQGSLWSQITALMRETIFASPVCDNYGRIFVEIDTALVPSASRASYPVVMAITRDDYENADIARLTVTKTGRVDMSGVMVTGAETGETVYSLADGHVFNRYGETLVLDQILLASQAQSNQLAADYKAAQNKTITVDITGMTNNRLIGITPHQFVSIAIASTDTLRGITYSGNLIVRRVDWMHDPQTGIFTMSLGCDPETTGALSVNGDIPVVDSGGVDTGAWTPPIIAPPPPIIIPPVIPPPVTGWIGKTIAILINGKGLFHTSIYTPGVWTNDTVTMSAYDLSTLYGFDLCRASGRAYITGYDNGQAWSTILGSNVRTLMGAAPTFKGGNPSYPDYWITHVAADQSVDNKCAVITKALEAVPPSYLYYWIQNFYLTDSAGVFVLPKTGKLEASWVNGPGQAMTYQASEDKWYYLTADQFDVSRIERIKGDLTTWENDLVLNAGWGAMSLAASSTQDILYAEPYNQLWKITALGTTRTLLSVAGSPGRQQQVACDPTGQYVIVIGGLYVFDISHSTDYGATFTSILATFPAAATSWDRGAANIVNMGDAAHWAVSVNDVGDAYRLHIFSTADAGMTWTDVTGNLTSVHVPPLSYVNFIRSA